MKEKIEAALDAAAQLTDLKGIGSDAMAAAGEDVNQILPAIERAGYSVQAIDIDIAIPPRIAIHCRMQTDLPDADREALLSSLEGTRFAKPAVQMLLQASDVQEKLKLGKLRVTDVIIEVGLTTGVKVRYTAPA